MANLPERIETLEKVGELHLKGYRPSEIAREVGLSPAQTKHYIEQYKEVVRKRVEQDPDFLDRIQEHTVEALDHMDMLIKETWATYESAKTEDMINQQINLLKVAGDLAEKRAKLLQLMGAKVDSGMNSRMQKAEQVNDLVARVIKDVVSHCDDCRVRAQVMLAEAFSMMGNEEEAADMEPVEKDNEVIDVEVEEEFDTDSMLADIVRDD
jgi:predicted transcriptional regulator